MKILYLLREWVMNCCLKNCWMLINWLFQEKCGLGVNSDKKMLVVNSLLLLMNFDGFF